MATRQREKSRDKTPAGRFGPVLFSIGLPLFLGSLWLNGNNLQIDSPGNEREQQLVGSRDSIESLARHFLRTLQHGDKDEVYDLALSKAEFEQIVFPSLPASRPGSNLSAEVLWQQTVLKSWAGFQTTLEHQGKNYELIAVRFADGVKNYGNFVIHRDARLRVRDEENRERKLNLFGSVIEKDGAFKIYSFVQ